MEKPNFNIWNGIYESFSEAVKDSTGNGFSGIKYEQQVFNNSQECLLALKNGEPIPFIYKERNILLPPIIALVNPKSEIIDILDFGGGLGIGYMAIKESIPSNKYSFNYKIVEVPEVCKKGNMLFSNDPDIEFFDYFPKDKKFDLVHTSSAIQYLENWKDILLKFSKYKPEYISLSDVFAGDIPTFVTLQKYYESLIPHWFLNLDELITVFEGLGYELVMNCYANIRRLNTYDILNMNNFPEEYRINHTLNLLFHKV